MCFDAVSICLLCTFAWGLGVLFSCNGKAILSQVLHSQKIRTRRMMEGHKVEKHLITVARDAWLIRWDCTADAKHSKQDGHFLVKAIPQHYWLIPCENWIRFDPICFTTHSPCRRTCFFFSFFFLHEEVQVEIQVLLKHSLQMNHRNEHCEVR